MSVKSLMIFCLLSFVASVSADVMYWQYNRGKSNGGVFWASDSVAEVVADLNFAPSAATIIEQQGYFVHPRSKDNLYSLTPAEYGDLLSSGTPLYPYKGLTAPYPSPSGFDPSSAFEDVSSSLSSLVAPVASILGASAVLCLAFLGWRKFLYSSRRC